MRGPQQVGRRLRVAPDVEPQRRFDALMPHQFHESLGRSGARQNLDDGQQTLWGVGVLIVVVNILGLLVGLAYLTIQGPAG